MNLVAPLFDGELDIIGDVHGEIEPLIALLATLGYSPQGEHPRGRRLVFVGDLVDRGPDSPAVVELAMNLVERNLAQWVLGNHELNLLRQESKAGNAWLLDPTQKEQQPGGEFSHCKVASPALRARLLDFLPTLPIALERSDLRVVHAAWIPDQIEELRAAKGSVVDLFRRYEECASAGLEADGSVERAKSEKEQASSFLHDRHARDVPLLEAMGTSEERHQMDNPIKVLTSGVERLAKQPFWASGQWRMCERVAWWNEYTGVAPVIVGHYWRRLQPIHGSAHAASKPDLFPGAEPLSWLGPGGNVFCVDYSVGARYEERKSGRKSFGTALAAMRWPEREIWGENGRLDDSQPSFADRLVDEFVQNLNRCAIAQGVMDEMALRQSVGTTGPEFKWRSATTEFRKRFDEAYAARNPEVPVEEFITAFVDAWPEGMGAMRMDPTAKGIFALPPYAKDNLWPAFLVLAPHKVGP